MKLILFIVTCASLSLPPIANAKGCVEAAKLANELQSTSDTLVEARIKDANGLADTFDSLANDLEIKCVYSPCRFQPGGLDYLHDSARTNRSIAQRLQGDEQTIDQAYASLKNAIQRCAIGH